MNANDFYGTPIAVTAKPNSIEMPQTTRNTSAAPAWYWAAMIAVLIGLRVVVGMAK